MNKKPLLLLAVAVLITPYLGFPDSWKGIISIILAFAIAYAVYQEDIRNFFTMPKHPAGSLVQGDSYVESTPVQSDVGTTSSHSA